MRGGRDIARAMFPDPRPSGSEAVRATVARSKPLIRPAGHLLPAWRLGRRAGRGAKGNARPVRRKEDVSCVPTVGEQPCTQPGTAHLPRSFQADCMRFPSPDVLARFEPFSVLLAHFQLHPSPLPGRVISGAGKTAARRWSSRRSRCCPTRNPAWRRYRPRPHPALAVRPLATACHAHPCPT
jgi:hypothetical protein